MAPNGSRDPTNSPLVAGRPLEEFHAVVRSRESKSSIIAFRERGRVVDALERARTDGEAWCGAGEISREDSARGDEVTRRPRTLFVLDLSLHVVDGVRGLHLQGDGLAGDCEEGETRWAEGSARGRRARGGSKHGRPRDSSDLAAKAREVARKTEAKKAEAPGKRRRDEAATSRRARGRREGTYGS